jgi:DNA-binding MarR family transcriptional regulator
MPMNTAKSDRRYEITWLVRRLFRSMAKAADSYLRASDLTAADRAVLEFLYPKARLSVPEIAGLYQVSRQHVQNTVNRLLAKGLVVTGVNPRHKRSPLILLSELGQRAFAEIRRNETALIERVFKDVGGDDLQITGNTLRSLLDKFNDTSLL